MDIKKQIEQDLKNALLSGDKVKSGTLKVIKSVILDSEIAKNKRDVGLDDAELVGLLQKEVKKRKDTAEIYKNAGDQDREQQELAEIDVIKSYLPEQMNEDEIRKIVDEITSGRSIEQKDMGKIIGLVRQKTSGQADGSMIAKLVKEKVS